jgi:ABC-type nitrate/sulfonate/bicarbonate transport system substrate-binding protein
VLHRRYVIQEVAALGVASVCPPIAALGQGRPLTKIRYNEVVRSLLYAPAYVAITNGYFKNAGLDITIATQMAATSPWRRSFPIAPTFTGEKTSGCRDSTSRPCIE